jgi:hypothetical protein
LVDLCKIEQKLELLYRGSLHFKLSDFHARCDNIPKTLTIIKSTNGNIFGGYTEATWDRSGTFKTDKNAYIFSLVNMENKPVKVNIAHGQERHAIYAGKATILVQFGYGGDFFLLEDKNGASNFGNSYKHPDYPLYSEKTKIFFAGSQQFKSDEIEVFQIY